MKRRNFLKAIGIGAVVAPAVVKADINTKKPPEKGWTLETGYMQRDGGLGVTHNLKAKLCLLPGEHIRINGKEYWIK